VLKSRNKIGGKNATERVLNEGWPGGTKAKHGRLVVKKDFRTKAKYWNKLKEERSKVIVQFDRKKDERSLFGIKTRGQPSRGRCKRRGQGQLDAILLGDSFWRFKRGGGGGGGGGEQGPKHVPGKTKERFHHRRERVKMGQVGETSRRPMAGGSSVTLSKQELRRRKLKKKNFSQKV